MQECARGFPFCPNSSKNKKDYPPKFSFQTKYGLFICGIDDETRVDVPDWPVVASNIEKLVEQFKCSEFPVIAGVNSDPTEALVDGQIAESGDKHIRFYRKDGFALTSGDYLECLKDNLWAGITAAVVVGVETHISVEQTVVELLRHGFKVCVIQDAVGSLNPSDNDSSINRMERMSGVAVYSMSRFMFLNLAETPIIGYRRRSAQEGLLQYIFANNLYEESSRKEAENEFNLEMKMIQQSTSGPRRRPIYSLYDKGNPPSDEDLNKAWAIITQHLKEETSGD